MKILVVAIVMMLSPAPIAALQAASMLEPLTVDGAEVTGIVPDPVSGAARYVAAGERLFMADAPGEWTETGTLAGGEAVIQDSDDPGVLSSGTEPECYRGGGGSTPLMRSDDGGATWVEVGNAGLAPLASWSDSGIVLAGSCPGLHVSVDNGDTFQTLDALPLGMQVTSFAVVEAPDDGTGPVVLVGLTGEGGTSYLHRVDLTDPAQPVVSEELLSWFAISPIGVGSEGAIYVGAPQGVLISEDDGATWETSRIGLESTTLEADPLVEFPPDLEPGSFGVGALLVLGERVIVAGVDGIYELGGGAGSWTQLASSDRPVTSLAVTVDRSELLCQTDDAVYHIAFAMDATPAA